MILHAAPHPVPEVSSKIGMQQFLESTLHVSSIQNERDFGKGCRRAMQNIALSEALAERLKNDGLTSSTTRGLALLTSKNIRILAKQAAAVKKLKVDLYAAKRACLEFEVKDRYTAAEVYTACMVSRNESFDGLLKLDSEETFNFDEIYRDSIQIIFEASDDDHIQLPAFVYALRGGRKVSEEEISELKITTSFFNNPLEETMKKHGSLGDKWQDLKHSRDQCASMVKLCDERKRKHKMWKNRRDHFANKHTEMSNILN